MNFRYKLMQFMSGRYGVDALFVLLFCVASATALVNCFVHSWWVQLIVYAIMAYAIFRAFSRNIEARRRENKLLRDIIFVIKGKRNLYMRRKADYNHIYKKCPRCRAVLRLPRRKGRHTTVCPKCNKEFKVYVFKA